jgi:hypothetical protein
MDIKKVSFGSTRMIVRKIDPDPCANRSDEDRDILYLVSGPPAHRQKEKTVGIKLIF